MLEETREGASFLVPLKASLAPFSFRIFLAPAHYSVVLAVVVILISIYFLLTKITVDEIIKKKSELCVHLRSVMADNLG